ncbi:hypothetical protein Hanom_Chr03g00198121 [Helianthus anomalus]
MCPYPCDLQLCPNIIFVQRKNKILSVLIIYLGDTVKKPWHHHTITTSFEKFA